MRFIAAALVTLALQSAAPPTPRAEIEMMRKTRATEVLGPNGWASLVGLHWLTPGAHTVGRDRGNDIVLLAASAPPALGTLTVTGDVVALQLAAGVRVTVKGQPAASPIAMRLNAPAAEGVTLGGMTMIVIKRGTQLGLRVWDRESPMLKTLHALEWYPIDLAWRIDAAFTPHTPAPAMKIQNVLGETVEMSNPGSVTFTVSGQTYHLEALLESANAKELFFMFTDGTSGKTTYKASRYLYTPLPKDGRVILDFNQAKNPPCAFTDFATCPLPPAANRLSLSVTAGELSDGHK